MDEEVIIHSTDAATESYVLLKAFPVKSAYQNKIKKILNQKICCGYLKEPCQWDGSSEHQNIC